MQKGKLVPELIAPCGMNCGICLSYFGYTSKGEKNMPAGPAGRGITYVRLFKNSAISWQLNKLSIVLSAQVFHVKI
jgi:hypothetical protein